MAALILRGERQGMRWGALPVASLIFDMNHLFESYVAAQLRRMPGYVVRTQRRATFWSGTDGDTHDSRPDFDVRLPTGERLIVDTKWKALAERGPSDADLRQLYVYLCQFEAQQGLLLYPAAGGNGGTAVGPPTTAASACGLTTGQFFDGRGGALGTLLLSDVGPGLGNRVRARLDALLRATCAPSAPADAPVHGAYWQT